MDRLKEEIYRLECSHLEPECWVSTDKLSEVLDDEFFEFGSSGGLIKRQDFEGDFPSNPDPMAIHFFEMHKLGPDAVLTTYQITNLKTGKLTNRSSVWKKRENGWRLFFHQGTVSASNVFE
ncbi:DUF4440 domain-containing protein [Planococcus kocurii]|uniref:DUF4440 domain-containing protein n=1 Tax=Planococcus kocurii TaxID=1374 RepID=A0ABM5X028_9BACL|nr:DUF4440 domain-containing protein [Planococcus kocurii]ALS79972.1 DUF4440 domain-containing protein [Planococcus kocurii]